MSDLPIHLRKVDLLTNVSVSTGLTHSLSQEVEDVISYAVQVFWTNGAILDGDIYLEASNDGTNWTQIQQSNLSISGSSGNHMINVEKPAYSLVRLTIDIFAGTATVSSIYNAKRQ